MTLLYYFDFDLVQLFFVVWIFSSKFSLINIFILFLQSSFKTPQNYKNTFQIKEFFQFQKIYFEKCSTLRPQFSSIYLGKQYRTVLKVSELWYNKNIMVLLTAVETQCWYRYQVRLPAGPENNETFGKYSTEMKNT